MDGPDTCTGTQQVRHVHVLGRYERYIRLQRARKIVRRAWRAVRRAAVRLVRSHGYRVALSLTLIPTLTLTLGAHARMATV